MSSLQTNVNNNNNTESSCGGGGWWVVDRPNLVISIFELIKILSHLINTPEQSKGAIIFSFSSCLFFFSSTYNAFNTVPQTQLTVQEI